MNGSPASSPPAGFRGRRGFALISVLIALAILMALLLPFLTSVLNEAGIAAKVVREEKVANDVVGTRDHALHIFARSHPSKETSAPNGTPDWDGRDEYRGRVVYPDAFRKQGRNPLRSAHVEDLARKIHLPTASPLVLGNLLGLATTLAEDHEPDADTITVSDATNFPENGGAILVHGERIDYAGREGSVFTGIHRRIAQKLPADCLVLDYRVVMAVTWQFNERNDGKRNGYTPYSTVAEVQSIGEVDPVVGRFTKREMDVLQAHCSTYGSNDFAAQWGRKLQIFNEREPDDLPGWHLRTKSALGMGGGCVVRIMSQEDPKLVEYNYVWTTRRPRGNVGVLKLQSRWQVNLLFPLQNHYKHWTAVVQPLVPVAVNINTADREVLVALLESVRTAPSRNPDQARDAQDPRLKYGMRISNQLAHEMAGELIALRSGATEDDGGRPFQGFEDLAKRFFHMRGKAAHKSDDQQSRRMLRTLLQTMLYGRHPEAESGTMPICFASNSLVEYRVASMQTLRSGLEAARREVTGIASVMPGHALDMLLYRQRGWLENIRLNRHSPNWISFPINIGAIEPWDLGTDPSSIDPGLLFAEFYPTAGFGELRFPSQDRGYIRLSTSVAQRVLGQKARQARMRIAHESNRYSQHPDGRDLDKAGAYEMINIGPRGQGAPPRKPRHPDMPFFFTTSVEGMPGRHAVSFWFELKSLGDQCVYDLAAAGGASDKGDRNRINVRFEAEHVVFEVLDEVGLDPNPSETRTQPERTAAVWRVPITDFNLKPNIPYHLNFAADGNRPDQLSILIDGVPRGKPEFMTYLEADLPEYKRPSQGTTPDQDKERYPEIVVESTEGFPEQGVLRIGRELFEYTSKTGTTFVCKPLDSFGGRVARMRLREYRQDIPIDKFGRPTINAVDLTGSELQDKTPKIPKGAAVELYGYAAALYRNLPVAVGTTKLRDSLGAFSIARARPVSPVTIALPVRNLSAIGEGFDDKTASDIYLLDPKPDEDGKKPPPSTAVDEIIGGFPESGGYALFVQIRFTNWIGQNNQTQSAEFANIGGLELIQYSKRAGNKLTGITRGVRIPGTEKFLSKNNGRYDPTGKARQFVADWNPDWVLGTKPPQKLKDLHNYVLYIVPVSIPVNDGAAALNDPAVTGLVEWAQIYPGKDREHDTEWVRYNAITRESHLVRVHDRAWTKLHRALTNQRNLNLTVDQRQGGTTMNGAPLQQAYETPQDDKQKRIGYIAQLEIDWPAIFEARRALQFRGDPFTELRDSRRNTDISEQATTSHKQDAGSLVMACHRLELDWGGLGAMSARCGRNDRVGMVHGTQAMGDSRPAVEWHTMNWVVRRHGGDNYSKEVAQNGVEPERWGPYSFQLVAFKDGVNDIFVGPADRQDFLDTRRVDRVVKFPSGELPAAYVEAGWFGSAHPDVGGYNKASGLVDEITAVGRHADTVLLNTDISADARQIPVRKHQQLYSYGTVGRTRDLTQTWPTHGGLMMIDGEIIAYASYADGIFEVALNGRGLLGTEARAHADAARVQFLAHVPCAILAGQVSAADSELVVQDPGSLPPYGGTVLMGTELLHYTWTGDKELFMPTWYAPDDLQGDGTGLFRGRYGTAPQPGPSGSPVIWFPFRYWDRYHKRSDDPELAYYQATRRETPVFFTGVQWREENPQPSFLELHTTVNIDGAGTFSDDPDKVRGMFYFEKGTVDDQPNKLGWQGSLAEVRFQTEYRPGAFDPVEFTANGWKQAILVKDLILNYEGETRILEERETGR